MLNFLQLIRKENFVIKISHNYTYSTYLRIRYLNIKCLTLVTLVKVNLWLLLD